MAVYVRYRITFLWPIFAHFTQHTVFLNVSFWVLSGRSLHATPTFHSEVGTLRKRMSQFLPKIYVIFPGDIHQPQKVVFQILRCTFFSWPPGGVNSRWGLWFWMGYLSEIVWRNSWDVCTLVPNNCGFLVCLAVGLLPYLN